jgi:NitT/TauT family transport system substrate-binding protein
MKRLLMFTTAALLAIVDLAASGTHESSRKAALAYDAPRTPLVIRCAAIKGPSGIGMIRMLDQTTLLPGGDTLSFSLPGSADAMVAGLLADQLDMAVLPINLAAKLYNAGLDFPLVAIVGNGMVKALERGNTIGQVEQLRGRTVHVGGQAATPEFVLKTILRHRNLSGNDGPTLSFSLPIPEIAASLIASRIDLAILPEPFATMARLGNPAIREAFDISGLWTEATGMIDYPMTALVMRASVLTGRPDTASAIIAAYRDSVERTVADPAAAAVLVERHGLGLSAVVAAQAIPVSNYVFIPAAAAKAQVEALLSIFMQFAPAAIGGSLPDASFYTD